ncbi:MAG: ribonuclease D [Saprospiraceae bacterium]|nr:ribonuclease D [Saprospiraceae bacterium]MDW8484553.1 ribonuclease D [Saprospiraceae bacterium]
MNYQVHFLDEADAYERAIDELAAAAWFGFDTEFVGEKTFVPILCLVQVVTEQHIYLIDALRIRDLRRFAQLLENEAILKITHAGDNDYRLLYALYSVVPANTFDTQIAAGFVGHNYPAAFAKIVERELRVSLAKSHTVANWEARPLDPKAIEYAVEDVKYLPALYHKLTHKLRLLHREAWAREENRKWEQPETYQTDPYKEALNSDYIHQLDFREKIFYLRLHRWRREKAQQLNVPKESILQSRHISTVVKAIKGGQHAFKANRVLNEGVWRRYLTEWEALWKTPPTDGEKALVNSLPTPAPDDPEREWTLELLYHFVRYQCIKHEISPALLLPRSDFNRLKNGDGFDPKLLEGWRAELLGEPLVRWLRHPSYLSVEWQTHACVLRMQ